MGTHWLDDVGVWLNDVDLAPFTDEAALRFTRDGLTVNNFASGGAVERKAGLYGVDWRLGGPNGFADPDDELWNSIENDPTDPVLTICPEGEDGGDIAYVIQPRALTRDAVGRHGEIARWQLAGTGASVANSYRGTSHGKGEVSLPKQTITGAVNGTGVQFSGLSSTDVLLFALHVFSDNGTSLDVIVESDDNSGFTTPTTRHTFAVTGVGPETSTYAAVLLGSDDWLRCRTANLVGTNFELAASIVKLRV